MRKKSVIGPIIVIALFLLSVMGSIEAQAGTKNMEATKRTKFKNDSVESMRDAFIRKEAEEKEYRQKMLSNSDQTVQLLMQVRDLLRQLNKKE